MLDHECLDQMGGTGLDPPLQMTEERQEHYSKPISPKLVRPDTFYDRTNPITNLHCPRNETTMQGGNHVRPRLTNVTSGLSTDIGKPTFRRGCDRDVECVAADKIQG